MHPAARIARFRERKPFGGHAELDLWEGVLPRSGSTIPPPELPCISAFRPTSNGLSDDAVLILSDDDKLGQIGHIRHILIEWSILRTCVPI